MRAAEAEHDCEDHVIVAMRQTVVYSCELKLDDLEYSNSLKAVASRIQHRQTWRPRNEGTQAPTIL